VVGVDEWEARRGEIAVRIRFTGLDQVQLVEDWVSDRFGVRDRGPVLVGSVAGLLPIRFGYRLVPSTVDAGVEIAAGGAR
jgi:hypothetical protein